MHDTLLVAETDNEMVHILSHVPVNTDSCVKAWDREYRRIVIRFAHIIAGQFNGHTHYDEFRLYYLPNTSEALNVAFNGGSGTSFVGLNSNYRIYYADDKKFVSIKYIFLSNMIVLSFIKGPYSNSIPFIKTILQEILDHETWIFNLTEANLHPDKSPNWFKEYSFKELYAVNDMSPSTLHKMLTDDWLNDKTKFIKVFHPFSLSMRRLYPYKT